MSPPGTPVAATSASSAACATSPCGRARRAGRVRERERERDGQRRARREPGARRAPTTRCRGRPRGAVRRDRRAPAPTPATKRPQAGSTARGSSDLVGGDVDEPGRPRADRAPTSRSVAGLVRDPTASAVDRHGEDEALAVVGVVADQVDPARRAPRCHRSVESPSVGVRIIAEPKIEVEARHAPVADGADPTLVVARQDRRGACCARTGPRRVPGVARGIASLIVARVSSAADRSPVGLDSDERERGPRGRSAGCSLVVLYVVTRAS